MHKVLRGGSYYTFEKYCKVTSRYGVTPQRWDIGTCDGMNEKGLVASLLFLPESIYSLPSQVPISYPVAITLPYLAVQFTVLSLLCPAR